VTKRLQVILQDPEYRDIQRAADAQRMTIAAWVRQALAMARRREPVGDSGKKLDVVRAATRHSYPSTDTVSPSAGDLRRLQYPDVSRRSTSSSQD
jgi:hypothetical protein